jgi:predicted pyridoxine 5'-phosphate oxidase superfamily flavin-nucleotide-binding protein
MMTDHLRYHEGELAVQARVGVGADGLGAQEVYHPAMARGVQHFLAAQQLAAVATLDEQGRPWASLRSGQPGFLRVLDEHTLEIGGYGHPHDPLLANLAKPGPVGVLAINLALRHRVRLNGEGQIDSSGRVSVSLNQVYGNCPQYIQAREVHGEREAEPSRTYQTEFLDERLRRWLANADTFFLATAHPNSGLDMSHRGGKPGFVRVENEKRFVFPDYAGNNMFNSLGNISSYPRAGLLFPDFKSGATLQITGAASIIWEGPQIAEFPGARRLVSIDIEKTVELSPGMLLQFEFKGYSPSLR